MDWNSITIVTKICSSRPTNYNETFKDQNKSDKSRESKKFQWKCKFQKSRVDYTYTCIVKHCIPIRGKTLKNISKNVNFVLVKWV